MRIRCAPLALILLSIAAALSCASAAPRARGLVRVYSQTVRASKSSSKKKTAKKTAKKVAKKATKNKQEDPFVTEEPDDDDSDSFAACFPGFARVLLSSGARVALRDLAVGDDVHVGGGDYSRVFAFTHREPHGTRRFVRLDAGGRALVATAGHYVHVRDGLKPMERVVRGDEVRMEEGDWAAVRSVRWVRAKGLYNPQTLHGDVAVDGVVASTYTTAVRPEIAHAFLAPLRAAYRALGVRVPALERAGELAGMVGLTSRGDSVSH